MAFFPVSIEVFTLIAGDCLHYSKTLDCATLGCTSSPLNWVVIIIPTTTLTTTNTCSKANVLSTVLLQILIHLILTLT